MAPTSVRFKGSLGTVVIRNGLARPWRSALLPLFPWVTLTLVASCSIVNSSAVLPRETEGDFVQKGGLHQVALNEHIGLEIEINDSWELEDTSTLQQILHEAAGFIYRHLRDRPRIKLIVGYDRERGPMALYRRRGQTTDTVLLSNTPLEYRPQIMYQFAHEFCHVVSDYNRLRSTESKNEWFHEALCELASIFVMHGTGEHRLKKYIDGYLDESIQVLDEIPDFGAWLLNKEPHLREPRDGGLDRKTNAVVAYRLHPLFVQHPEIWGTLKSLPKSDSVLVEYLEEWKQNVENQDRGLIDRIAETLLPGSLSAPK